MRSSPTCLTTPYSFGCVHTAHYHTSLTILYIMKTTNISDTVNALTLDQLEYHLICSCLPQVDDYASEAQAREHLIQHLEEEREFFSKLSSTPSSPPSSL